MVVGTTAAALLVGVGTTLVAVEGIKASTRDARGSKAMTRGCKEGGKGRREGGKEGSRGDLRGRGEGRNGRGCRWEDQEVSSVSNDSIFVGERMRRWQGGWSLVEESNLSSGSNVYGRGMRPTLPLSLVELPPL